MNFAVLAFAVLLLPRISTDIEYQEEEHNDFINDPKAIDELVRQL